MSSGQKNIDNKSDDQLLIIKATIEPNMQDSEERTNNITEYLTEIITSTMDQIKMLKYSPEKKYSSKAQDPTTVITDNKKSSPLEDGNSTKNGGLWNFIHETSLPKLYELLINT